MPYQTLLTLLFAVVWTLKALDKWLVSMSAILTGLTIAEF